MSDRADATPAPDPPPEQWALDAIERAARDELDQRAADPRDAVLDVLRSVGYPINEGAYILDALGAAGLQVVPAAATWYTDEIERLHREIRNLRGLQAVPTTSTVVDNDTLAEYLIAKVESERLRGVTAADPSQSEKP